MQHKSIKNYKGKSQMEIMGLAVIVILISLGIFFIITINKEGSNIKKSFTQTQLASNILSSMLRTTTLDCSRNSINQLLKDCAENYNSPNTQLRCQNNQRSCDYLGETISYILGSTLKAWGNQSYSIEAKIPGQIIFAESSGRCSGEKESKQGYIQTSAGTLTVTMDICG